jgi:DNA-binding response OmpR family regulator
MDQLGASWSETEFLVDWLIQTSSLSKILEVDTQWQGTLAHTRATPAPHVQQLSQEFLAHIGVIAKYTKSFTISAGNIYFEDQPLTTLTSREVALLTLLITKSPNPVTDDEIGDILFIDDETYSLATIAKTIERLRTKLDEMGISRQYLATASGVGYYLKN